MLDGHESTGILYYKLKNPVNLPAFLNETAVNLIGNPFPVQTAAVLILSQKFIDNVRL